ncbi:MAG: pyridoxal phosphate-dependent aminotransferase [Pseudomonadota bacterium]
MSPVSPLVASARQSAQRAPISGIITAVNYGRDRDGLIPLWAGEGDLPTPRFISDAAAAALVGGETFYTHQRGIPDLRQALADYYGRHFPGAYDPDTFFITCSGMQAIQISIALTAGDGDEILIPSPSWPNAAGAAVIAGAQPVTVPFDEEGGVFNLNMDRLAAAVTPRTKALFLNSPANPTGWTASQDKLVEVLAFARQHGLWIIADEIYSRFYWLDGPRAPSFLDIADPEDRILYVNTFSKNWAMTGWRMGWIHAPLPLKQTLENLIQYSTSGVAQFMQRAGTVALDDGEWFVEHTIARARRGRQVVSDALAGHNRITYAPPDGAFYAFLKVDGLASSQAATFSLIDDANVGTAPGTAFGAEGEGFVRICFARSEASLSEAMERILQILR